ncbi:hypothetical protein CLV62_12235 [Dysgonomonas alginatilytica]|uniref:Uncharacterized protein n=1 Tax=Dysgonomonas alginatilytica TaxID=1605892 RepID=A0A2V3PMT1_9BACT|nr:hypothetical protein [Dysgonomonas alginatilytica]PXV62082.1 hypothetical protein CLV62_12235 [Dysgonomonas alginatilytica]
MKVDQELSDKFLKEAMKNTVVVYEGKEYIPRSLESVYLEDIVSINSYVGYVDFIGYTEIVIVTEKGENKYIQYSEIKEAFLLRIENGMGNPI